MTGRFRQVFLSAIAFGVIASVSPVRAEDPKPRQENAKMIEGKWSIDKAELAGQPFPAEVAKTMTLILEKDKYTLKSPGPDDIGTLTIDPAKTPKQMDIKGVQGPNQGKTFLAIYELDGDSLKICYDLAGKTRPVEFKTAAGTTQFLVVYKRVKE